jgi:hypothetical protein
MRWMQVILARIECCFFDPFASRYAPYQALVQSNNTLVYVPLDNTAYIRPFYSEQQPELLEKSSDGPSNESKWRTILHSVVWSYEPKACLLFSVDNYATPS